MDVSDVEDVALKENTPAYNDGHKTTFHPDKIAMVCLDNEWCGSSGSKVPILTDSTTVHYTPYTTVCCIVVAIYSLHVEVNPSF